MSKCLCPLSSLKPLENKDMELETHVGTTRSHRSHQEGGGLEWALLQEDGGSDRGHGLLWGSQDSSHPPPKWPVGAVGRRGADPCRADLCGWEQSRSAHGLRGAWEGSAETQDTSPVWNTAPAGSHVNFLQVESR